MQTVIAAFDNIQSAQSSVERLIQHGFERRHVHLQPGHGDTATASTTMPSNQAGAFNEVGRVGDFFGNLFDGDATSGDAGNYAEAVRRGSTVVVVDAQTDAEVEQARALMYELGSVDIEQRAQQWKERGWSGFDAESMPLSSDELSAERQRVMPVVQEELQVGKRTVATGSVRVVKRVTETPVSELVTLRRERAVIERRPVDRVATEADFAGFKESTFEVRETSEEAIVSKTARIVEEVVVGKEVTERAETVSDSLRRTDVEVERVDGSATPATTGYTAGRVDQTSAVIGTSAGSGDANRDPITGEPGAHPVGTGIGAALGGAATGAATGTVAGPVGTVIGAAVGAIAGGLAGKGVAEQIDPTDPAAGNRKTGKS